MIPFDPPNTFRNGQTLDQNDVQENVHHWVQLIKRIAEQRYVHSSVSFKFGSGPESIVSESFTANLRTIRWNAPYDVYVEGVAAFVNQSTAVTGTLQFRFSNTVPTGLANSILLTCELAGTNTTNLIQPFSRFTGFYLAKSTDYDIVFEAASSETFDLRHLDLQLQIKTDRWSNDSAIPASVQKRIDASGNATATNINAILADVEADIATCQSNSYNPVPNSFMWCDLTGGAATGYFRSNYPSSGSGGSIMGKWGRMRIRALQGQYCLTASIATAYTITAKLLGKSSTNQLSYTVQGSFGAAGSTYGAFKAVTSDIGGVAGDTLDDKTDDKHVVKDIVNASGTVRAHNANIIIWES